MLGPPFANTDNYQPKTTQCLAEAIQICHKLRQAGHVAYFAGGCVRDAMLGREPKDFDVATDATPDRVREIFGKRKTLAIGAAFGVIAVLPHLAQATEQATEQANHPTGDQHGRQGIEPIEVATFRSDGEYLDGRRPSKVRYGDARHDALRRDFTINGMFFDPAANQVIDFVGGRDDLQRQMLRTIGDAEQRFEEDKLRMLRAVRFTCTLGFTLDAAALQQIQRQASEITVVSDERIGAEMRRVVAAPRTTVGLELLRLTNLHRHILPSLQDAEWAPLAKLLQARERFEFETSLTLLIMALHVDQPARDQTLHGLTKRWRLSNEEVRRIRSAMRWHGVVMDAEKKPWSAVQPVLVDRDIDAIMSVARCVITANQQDRSGYERCLQALAWQPQQLDPCPLLSGDDLKAAGYRPGRQFKDALQAVRAAQLDGEIDSGQQALSLAAKYLD